MSQLQGIAAFENGNALVIAAAGEDWISVDAPDWFTRVGTAVPYFVGAPATLVSGIWRLNLTAPYAGVSEPTGLYLIHQEFGPDDEPILKGGDTEMKMLFNRAMQVLYERYSTGGGGGSGFQPGRQTITLSSGSPSANSAQSVPLHSIKLTMSAGSYTGNLSLPRAGRLNGDRVEVRIEYPGTAGPIGRIFDNTTGGTKLFERGSVDPSEIWKFSAVYNGSSWDNDDAHQVT